MLRLDSCPLSELGLFVSLLSLSLCWCCTLYKRLYSLKTFLNTEKNFDLENCINNGRSVESVKSKSMLVWFYCNASTFHDFIINSVKQYVLFSRTGVLKSDGTGTFYNLPILQFGHELILTTQTFVFFKPKTIHYLSNHYF